jgi:hypothetical protein
MSMHDRIRALMRAAGFAALVIASPLASGFLSEIPRVASCPRGFKGCVQKNHRRDADKLQPSKLRNACT